jgi:hypothetical protein
MSTDERPEDTRERETGDHGQGYRFLYPRWYSPAEIAGIRARGGDGDQRERAARAPRHSVPRRRNR